MNFYALIEQDPVLFELKEPVADSGFQSNGIYDMERFARAINILRYPSYAEMVILYFKKPAIYQLEAECINVGVDNDNNRMPYVYIGFHPIGKPTIATIEIYNLYSHLIAKKDEAIEENIVLSNYLLVENNADNNIKSDARHHSKLYT